MKKYLIAMVIGGALGFYRSGVIGLVLGSLGLTLLLLLKNIFFPYRQKVVIAPAKKAYTGWTKSGYAGHDDWRKW